MADASRQSKSLREKIKLGLIPALGAILFAALGGDGETPGVDVTPATVVAPASEALTHTTTSVSNARRPNSTRRQEWPIISLENVLAHNPFAFPIALRPVTAELPAVAQREQTPAEIESAARHELQMKWESAEMTAFYRSPQGPVAIVGSQVLHEGDTVEEDLRVIEIRPDGVTYGTPGP